MLLDQQPTALYVQERPGAENVGRPVLDCSRQDPSSRCITTRRLTQNGAAVCKLGGQRRCHEWYWQNITEVNATVVVSNLGRSHKRVCAQTGVCYCPFRPSLHKIHGLTHSANAHTAEADLQLQKITYKTAVGCVNCCMLSVYSCFVSGKQVSLNLHPFYDPNNVCSQEHPSKMTV